MDNESFEAEKNILVHDAVCTEEHEETCAWRRGRSNYLDELRAAFASIDRLRDKVKNIYLHVGLHYGRLGPGSCVHPHFFRAPCLERDDSARRLMIIETKYSAT